MKILVTGKSGFIDAHVALYWVKRGNEIIGFDTISGCCDVASKQARLDCFEDRPNYTQLTTDTGDQQMYLMGQGQYVGVSGRGPRNMTRARSWTHRLLLAKVND